jgi:hypothetical protein
MILKFQRSENNRDIIQTCQRRLDADFAVIMTGFADRFWRIMTLYHLLRPLEVHPASGSESTRMCRSQKKVYYIYRRLRDTRIYCVKEYTLTYMTHLKYVVLCRPAQLIARPTNTELNYTYTSECPSYRYLPVIHRREYIRESRLRE